MSVIALTSTRRWRSSFQAWPAGWAITCNGADMAELVLDFATGALRARETAR